MYIDVHCHLDLVEKERKIESVIKNALKNNVKIIVANGVNKETNKKVLEYSENYKEIKASLGLYPIDALSMDDNEINEVLRFIEDNKGRIVAIGEIGLDFKETEDKKRQIEIFKKILKVARKINKTVIIHSRKAEKECIDIMEKEKIRKAVMHFFSGKINLINKIIKNNWLLSIPTIVKNSEHFQKIVEIAPIENLLCETDSPFAHHNKERINEPANVIYSYSKIAEIKRLNIKEVEKIIEDNYKRVFINS